MSTNLEINFIRLLKRCELIAKDKENIDWRLEKYVGALEVYLCDLRKGPSVPPTEKLAEYTREVNLLKGIINAEKLCNPSEKVLAADQIPLLKSSQNTNSKELRLHTKTRYQNQVRDELFVKKKEVAGSGDLRQRKPGSAGLSGKANETEEDIDIVLKQHAEIQDQLANDMVLLARNLKENAKTAGRIVQKDNQKLADSSKLADTNYEKLKVESERLETHVQKSCNCWIWLMLVLVCGTFVFMVLLMKLFPKKS